MVSSKAVETIDDDKVKLCVDEKYRIQIRKMLQKHDNLGSGRLGNVNITQNGIDLIHGARSFNSSPYQESPKTVELEQFEVDKQLNAVVIEKSVSEWASPVLFSSNKSGRLQFCFEYRKRKMMTIKDSYPLPRMDERIDILGEAKVFTTLDAYNGYCQVSIALQDS